MFQNSLKNKFIFFIILFLVSCVLTIILIADIKSDQADEKISEPDISPAIINLTPEFFQDKPSPTTMPFTGVDDAANEKYLLEHPTLKTEAELQAQTPIELNGFTLDYSYEDDKFTVRLKPPFEQSKSKFEQWKESLGLTDPNRFIIL